MDIYTGNNYDSSSHRFTVTISVSSESHMATALRLRMQRTTLAAED